MTTQAISNPTSLIEAEWAASPSLEAFDTRVSARFSSTFSAPADLMEIPALTSTTAKLPPAGQLVRFRAMVQDTGLGSEVYRARGSAGQVLGYGIEDTEDPSAGAEDYANLRERQVVYLISVPGETAWVKESLDKTNVSDLDAAVRNLSIGSSSTSAPLLANKTPLPLEPHFGCIAKLYGEAADSLKIAEVREFVGILTETAFSSSFDDLVNSDAPPATVTVPALHILFSSPAPSPTQPFPPSNAQDVIDLRASLLSYLASALGGDEDAAEWTLLALLARIHTRHSTGMILGSLSLNLAVPVSFPTTLLSKLSHLSAKLANIPLSIPFLNEPKTRLAPRNQEENLESGMLQLSDGSIVVVDTRDIGEGKLEDAGVKNLRHVATTIAQQKLAYLYPFSEFELDTDLNFIVLSEGKAIIPTDCVVYVIPSKDFEPPPAPTEEQLGLFRSFLATMKDAQFTIPAEMSEFIQSDFVDRRQKSVGGEGMTQEDLLFRMGAARLLTLSHGETALSKEAWLKTAELDERRKDRGPLVAASRIA